MQNQSRGISALYLCTVAVLIVVMSFACNLHAQDAAKAKQSTDAQNTISAYTVDGNELTITVTRNGEKRYLQSVPNIKAGDVLNVKVSDIAKNWFIAVLFILSCVAGPDVMKMLSRILKMQTFQ